MVNRNPGYTSDRQTLALMGGHLLFSRLDPRLDLFIHTAKIETVFGSIASEGGAALISNPELNGARRPISHGWARFGQLCARVKAKSIADRGGKSIPRGQENFPGRS